MKIYIDFDDINEPEDIIEHGDHNGAIAASMPKLWRIENTSIPKVKIHAAADFDPSRPYSHLTANPIPSNPDFFLAQGDGYIGWFTRERGLGVLSRQLDDYLSFVEIPCSPLP